MILESKTDRLPIELSGLGVNLSVNARNAETFCDETALKFLVKKVVKTRDPLLLKILRNLASHDSTKFLFLVGYSVGSIGNFSNVFEGIYR